MLAPIISDVDSEKINAKKEKMGYSFVLIGKRANIHSNRLAALLRGQAQWRTDVLQRVLDVLEIDCEDVIKDKEVLRHYKRELQLEAQYHASETSVAMEA